VTKNPRLPSFQSRVPAQSGRFARGQLLAQRLVQFCGFLSRPEKFGRDILQPDAIRTRMTPEALERVFASYVEGRHQESRRETHVSSALERRVELLCPRAQSLIVASTLKGNTYYRKQLTRIDRLG
jgi:hypothetical protein